MRGGEGAVDGEEEERRSAWHGVYEERRLLEIMKVQNRWL
jgi:hypothetical protein